MIVDQPPAPIVDDITLMDGLRKALAAGPRCPVEIAAEMHCPLLVAQAMLDAHSYQFQRVAPPVGNHWWWDITVHERARMRALTETDEPLRR